MHGAGKWLFALFIWIAVWGAILSLDKGKWLPTIGAFIRIVLLTVFVGTVIVFGIEHGVHGFGIGSFKPTCAVFIAAVPVLFFNYVGFELPSTAGEELKNPQRDVPFTVVRAGITTVGVGFYVLGRDTRRHMVSVPLAGHSDAALAAPAVG